MSKVNRSIRQRNSLIGLAVLVAVSGFIIGTILPWNRRAGQATSLPVNLPVQNQNKNQSPTSSPAVGGTTGDDQGQSGVSDTLGKAAQKIEQEVLLTFSVPEQFQGKVVKEAKLSGKDKVIALTFDDGPWPRWTEQILDILKKNNIKATFFMVGEVVQDYPQLAKQVVLDGHAIGNHTRTHPYHQFNEAGASEEIDRTAELIYKTTGVRTSLFRPPGGILTNGLAAYAQKQNNVVVMWSDDATDYRRPSPERLAHNVLRDAKPGGIVLMHDGGGNRSNTVAALPEIISELKKQGYKFVTLPELLEMQEQEQAVTAATPNQVTSH